MEPKYPNIRVELVGRDGNAFFIIARTTKALRRGGVSEKEIAQFKEEATSGDYDNLLQTVMRWVSAQ